MSDTTKETAHEIKEAISAINDVPMDSAKFWATVLPFQRAGQVKCLDGAISRLIEMRGSAPTDLNDPSPMMFSWNSM